MQGSVAFDWLSVDIRTDGNEIFGDFEVTLVTGDHEAGMAMSIGNFDIWKNENVVQIKETYWT